MGKKSIALLIVVIMCCTLIFTACNKDKYTNPVTGEQYILVTDENGEKVLSEDGELLVYATEENGEKIKDDEGNFVTEVHGFVGQLESNGVVEDYAYYFTLPSGWKTVSDRGEFENKSQNWSMNIKIIEYSYSEYYDSSKKMYENMTKEGFEDKTQVKSEAYWDEFKYENAQTKVNLFSTKVADAMTFTMFFKNSDNLYVISLESDNNDNFEEAKAEMVNIYESLKFKPYTYYPDFVETTAK